MQEYLITLIETTTKTMLITAPSKNEAVETALLFHLGASDAEGNARIKSLTTHVVGSVLGEEANLSESSIHSYAVDYGSRRFRHRRY